MRECPKCNGRGKVNASFDYGHDAWLCDRCSGTGSVEQG